MRNIGVIESESDAQRFSDYLFSQGIENQVEKNREGTWSVWVARDEQLDEAERELNAFLLTPDAPQYGAGARKGRHRRKEEQAEAQRARSRVIDVRTRWDTDISRMSGGPVTGVLIALSIAATVLMHVPQFSGVRELLSIASWREVEGGLAWSGDLSDILHGQVWRLITPIFLHFGILHILFNMLWLRSLGGSIELHEGWRALIVKVLVLGVASNVAQYYWSGPFFGGMSGVVYGLFSYLWICARYDPNTRYTVDSSTVTLMIVWFFLGITGLVGPIANVAHGVGLVGGIIWAAIRTRRIPFLK